MATEIRPLRVFLCHSSNDKPAVRELYQKVRAESWIQPWLDEEELYPGQDWNLEIQKAIKETDAILVCLSKSSITKEGYVQREIKTALDYSDEKPERTVYIIPVRLEECKLPERLSKWHYADYFEGQRERGFQRLLVSLHKRAESLGLKIVESEPKKKKTFVETSKGTKVLLRSKTILSNGMEFMRVPAGEFLMGKNYDFYYRKEMPAYPQHTVNIPYDYWMARFPITNEQYNLYIKSKEIGHPVSDWRQKGDHPVVNVSWYNAMDYCRWLNGLFYDELPSNLLLRLPSEAEWEKAARGIDGRKYPWGNIYNNSKCHSASKLLFGNYTYKPTSTVSVRKYSPGGDSPYGCSDMLGNTMEWTNSIKKKYPYDVNDGRENDALEEDRVMRSCGYEFLVENDGCYNRYGKSPADELNILGFRICLAPPFPK